MKKIAIIGGGPIGLTVAAHLKNAGHHITVCDVSKNIRDNIINNGIHITGIRELNAYPDKVAASIDELSESPPDIIFVTVKATALELVSHALQDFFTENISVISWQNGIDTEKVLEKNLGSKNLFRGVINHGVGTASSGYVNMSFENPPHYLCELDPGYSQMAVELSEMLTVSGLITERNDDINTVIWQKTILNAALNGFCALTGMTLKEAVFDPYAESVYDNILKESIKVARGNEILLGKDFYINSRDYLSKVGHHKPSMLMDIEAGRRTEIDFINGKIKEYGQYAGIETPYNTAIIALIKSKEKMILTK